jgi:proline iminopeptidase
MTGSRPIRSAFSLVALAATLLALALSGCAKPAPRLARGEGMLPVDGGRIWYRVSGAGDGVPLVLLHGGPGFSSYYLKAYEDLGDERPVVRYDQLGGGKSDALTDTTKMTIAHFVDELEALRAHLGVEKMHLLGHSWGSILAVEYQRVHPERVASMVLAGAALDIPAWEQHAGELKQTLTEASQKAIARAEASGKFDAPDYQAAMADFYGRYVWRHPVQADLDSTLSTMSQAVYGFMEGPSEFTITGTLKGYDFTPHLGDIKIPLLYSVGEFDEAGPDNVRHFASLTPGATVAVIPGAGHISTWDNRDESVRVVREFLRGVDGAKR